MSDYRIPDTITRDQLLGAMAPLLDLLGVDANETYTDMVLTSDEITFGVVARAADDFGDVPTGMVTAPGLADPPQDAAELYHHITVRVVG